MRDGGGAPSRYSSHTLALVWAWPEWEAAGCRSEMWVIVASSLAPPSPSFHPFTLSIPPSFGKTSVHTEGLWWDGGAQPTDQPTLPTEHKKHWPFTSCLFTFKVPLAVYWFVILFMPLFSVTCWLALHIPRLDFSHGSVNPGLCVCVSTGGLLLPAASLRLGASAP